jgi:hypothetical protein
MATKSERTRTRKKIRRRKIPKAKKRVRRRKITVQLTVDDLIDLVLSNSRPKKRVRRRRKVKVAPAEVASAAAAAPSTAETTADTGYMTAVSKEASANEFAAKIQALKEHDLEIAVNSAELARLQIENGHSESVKDIVAFHKANGVTVSQADALDIIKHIDKLQKDKEQLKNDLVIKQGEHDAAIEQFQQEQKQASLIADSLNYQATVADKQATAAKTDLAKTKQDLDKAKYERAVELVDRENSVRYEYWYSSLKYAALQKLAKTNGVSSTGTKLVIFKRIKYEPWFVSAFPQPKYAEYPDVPPSLASTGMAPPEHPIPKPMTDADYDEMAADYGELDLDPQTGGARIPTKARGLSDVDINRLMRKHARSGWVGCFASDEMSNIPIKSTFGFIINTKPRSVSHGHWVACYIDTKRAKSIEYFDPFGVDPTSEFMHDLKSLVESLDTPDYLKLKINRIKVQDIMTDSCGWHAMNFLLRRFNGHPFRAVSGFDDSIKGEKDAAVLKQKYKTYGYI